MTAKFLTSTTKKLTMSDKETKVAFSGDNAAKTGKQDTSLLGKATSTVAVAGDDAGKKGTGKDTSAWGKATSTVGVAGDEAGK